MILDQEGLIFALQEIIKDSSTNSLGNILRTTGRAIQYGIITVNDAFFRDLEAHAILDDTGLIDKFVQALKIKYPGNRPNQPEPESTIQTEPEEVNQLTKKYQKVWWKGTDRQLIFLWKALDEAGMIDDIPKNYAALTAEIFDGTAVDRLSRRTLKAGNLRIGKSVGSEYPDGAEIIQGVVERVKTEKP
jgi:hypothetical protein